MLRKIGIGLACLFLSIFGYLTHKYMSNKVGIAPLPYNLGKPSPDQIKKAEAVQVLFIGDKFSQKFSNYVPQLNKRLSKNLRYPLKVYNWSEEYLGFNRVVNNILAMKEPPRIIVIMTGLTEFYEKKYVLNQYSKIKKNINKFFDPQWRSAFMLFPPLSRLIYRPIKSPFNMGVSIPFDWNGIDDYAAQKYIQSVYKLFEIEVWRLMRFLRGKRSRLIVVTPALMLTEPPRKVCKNASTPSIEKMLNSIESLKAQGRIKEAFADSNNLIEVSMGNPNIYFQNAQLAMKMGLYSKAKASYYYARSYDCIPGEGSIILNKILMQQSEENYHPVIDFNRIVNVNLGKDALFGNDGWPQEPYFNKLVDQLEVEIKKILNIKR